jgi:tRNA(Ile)-lysidine synthase TilS/MesJ
LTLLSTLIEEVIKSFGFNKILGSMLPDKCVNCGGKLFIALPYGPHKYCRKHFKHYFEKRLRKNVRWKKMVGKKERIALAVSGRAGSTAMLYLLQDMLPEQNELVVLHLDEGMEKKRLVKGHCQELGLKCKVEKLKGDKLKVLKKMAKKEKAKKLALGLTLEDEAALILKQLLKGKLKAKKEKFVVSPLSTAPEKEIKTWLKVKKIKFDKKKEKHESLQEFKKLLEKLEKGQPGTKFQLISSFDKLKQII